MPWRSFRLRNRIAVANGRELKCSDGQSIQIILKKCKDRNIFCSCPIRSSCIGLFVRTSSDSKVNHRTTLRICVWAILDRDLFPFSQKGVDSDVISQAIHMDKIVVNRFAVEYKRCPDVDFPSYGIIHKSGCHNGTIYWRIDFVRTSRVWHVDLIASMKSTCSENITRFILKTLEVFDWQFHIFCRQYSRCRRWRNRCTRYRW